MPVNQGTERQPVLEAVTQTSYFHQLQERNNAQTRMWANAQRDGRPAKHRWRPLFNAAKFG